MKYFTNFTEILLQRTNCYFSRDCFCFVRQYYQTRNYVCGLIVAEKHRNSVLPDGTLPIRGILEFIDFIKDLRSKKDLQHITFIQLVGDN